MPAFILTKWYADAVDPATGHLVICYDSELRWGNLVLRFTNQLHCQPPAAPRTSARFGAAAHTRLATGGSSFTLRQRGVQGIWQQLAAPLREVLLDTPAGQVLWECHLPAAAAKLALGPARLHGLGYVEQLTLTLPPWQLPLHTLRWGRFLAAGHTLVWIQWEGQEPRHLLFHNGRRYEQQGYIGDDRVACGAWQLTFGERHPLRAGPVGGTVFRRFAWFRRLVPARILELHETKWLSAATLTGAGGETLSGYAVHERVSWPQ